MSLFIKTDVDIAFDIALGFTVADVSNITVMLEKGDFVLTKSLGSGITEVDGSFIVSIARTEITTTGVYDLYARITDTGGKQRGISLSPSKVEFVKFPINA